MDDVTAKIRLGRIRFLGLEAIRIREEIATFLDRLELEGISVPTEEYRSAIALYSYLEDFSREALF